MRIHFASTFTIADVSGPELDLGALHRVLGEMAWYPTAFLDGRYIRWSPIDDHRAEATLHVNGRHVSGVFEFDAADVPVRFSAERYRDIGGGKSVLTPFTGEYRDYRDVNGLLVPHEVDIFWHVDGQSVPTARFRVENFEYPCPSGMAADTCNQVPSEVKVEHDR
jgi:hypothetical protein